MAREAQKKTIGDIQVTVTPFPAVEALRVQAMLLGIIGPALGRAAGALEKPLGAKSLLEVSVNGDALSGAIAELAGKLDEDHFMAIVRRLLRGTLAVVKDAEGKAQVVSFENEQTFDNAMDMVFGGRTMAVYSVVAFVIQVNYPDFFKVLGTGGLLGRILSLPKAAESEGRSSSPSDHSGA